MAALTIYSLHQMARNLFFSGDNAAQCAHPVDRSASIVRWRPRCTGAAAAAALQKGSIENEELSPFAGR